MEEMIKEIYNKLTILESMQSDIKGLQTEIKDIQTEIKDIRTEIKDIRTEIKELQTEIKDIRTEIKELQIEIRDLQIRIIATDAKINQITTTLENETNRNIKIIAEGHVDLARNLDDALKLENEKEMLMIRVHHLESEVKKMKQQMSVTA